MRLRLCVHFREQPDHSDHGVKDGVEEVDDDGEGTAEMGEDEEDVENTGLTRMNVPSLEEMSRLSWWNDLEGGEEDVDDNEDADDTENAA